VPLNDPAVPAEDTGQAAWLPPTPMGQFGTRPFGANAALIAGSAAAQR